MEAETCPYNPELSKHDCCACALEEIERREREMDVRPVAEDALAEKVSR